MSGSTILDTKISDCNIVNYKASYKMYLNEKKKRNQFLCFNVTGTTYLILTNNEINAIIGFYLSIWSIHQERDYILKNDLLEHFKKESKGFVNHFFQNNHIECNEYILFVCFFLFYSIPNIVSVLIAMCGVNSNIIITKEKIDLFFHYFDLNISEDKSLLKVMDNTRRAYTNNNGKAYDKKTFHLYMLDNYTLITALHTLKEDIINDIFIISPVDKIHTRVNYYSMMLKNTNYTDNINNLTLLQLPPEPCLSKTLRVLFTNNPHPFFYNFYVTSSVEQEKSLVMYQIKMRFGYSKRQKLTHFFSFQSKSISLKNGLQSPLSSPHKDGTLDPAFYKTLSSKYSSNVIFPCSN